MNFDAFMGVIVVLVLAIATVPLLRWIARKEDPAVLNILYWALALKAIFTLVRYFVITVVYADNGDAGVYSGGGEYLMHLYRQGNFVFEVPALAGRGEETNRIAVVVGFIYMITGVSRYAASFVFSWLCLVGQLLMYRAFRRGVPDGDSRRYALLVLLLPSMLFWPSSIGKEALMVFSIGIASFGAAKLLSSAANASGLLIFLIGTAGLFFVRPHMSLIAIVSLAMAGVVSVVTGFSQQEDKRASARPFAIRVLALGVLLAGAGIATTQVGKVLGDGTGPEDDQGLTSVLERTKAQTSEGGSSYDPIAVTSPVDFPAAMVTVLVRPFPWEAHSVNSVIASGEGVLLLSVAIAGRRRLITWTKALARRPYLVYCLAFTVTFIVAFSYIANFGILARQRTQMLPLMLTILAMPIAPRIRRSWFGSAPRTVTTKATDPAPSLHDRPEEGRR
ncbi:MAG: hypothetical protein K1X38_14170 [Microthrixaceae bacterium]|nr:hypothetical protein [Microthrixaceae bacterium]